MKLRRYSKLISGDDGRIRLFLPSSMSSLLFEVRLRDTQSYFEEDLMKSKWYRKKGVEVLLFNEL